MDTVSKIRAYCISFRFSIALVFSSVCSESYDSGGYIRYITLKEFRRNLVDSFALFLLIVSFLSLSLLLFSASQ